MSTLRLINSIALTALLIFSAGVHADGNDNHDANDAIGQPGVADQVVRSITIDMNDAMRFNPAQIEVQAGQTVRFVISNSGQLGHEFILGSKQGLSAHEMEMRQQPGMQHAEPNMLTLAGGQTGTIIWQFGQAGQVEFACLQPGHYELGMKGSIRVAQADRK